MKTMIIVVLGMLFILSLAGVVIVAGDYREEHNSMLEQRTACHAISENSYLDFDRNCIIPMKVNNE